MKKCHNDVKECPNEERQVWLLPEGQAGAQNCLGAGRCNFARRTSRCRKMPEERQVWLCQKDRQVFLTWWEGGKTPALWLTFQNTIKPFRRWKFFSVDQAMSNGKELKRTVGFNQYLERERKKQKRTTRFGTPPPPPSTLRKESVEEQAAISYQQQLLNTPPQTTNCKIVYYHSL